ncbi:MAG: hypothetical protein QM755_14810 [Luteolibacter sp.]
MMPGPAPVPRGWLWTYLLLPSGSIGVALAACMALDQARMLGTNGSIVQLLLILEVLIAIGCSIGFGVLMSRRFKAGHTVLLVLGYLIGQAVVCFAVFFGCCLLVMGGMKF